MSRVRVFEGSVHFLHRSPGEQPQMEGPMGFPNALVDQSNASSLASPDLSDDRYLLSALLDHTPDSIYFKDVQGRFVKVNCIQAQRLQVSNPCEAIGKTDQDFFGGEHSKSALQDELEIIRSGLSWIDRQERRDWPAGNVTWASTSKRPLFDRAGKCIGILGISRDITSSKETESTLGHAQLPARRLYASAD